MARKHTIKKEKETNYNAKTGDVTITETEEHVIVDTHTFMQDANDEDEDMMFIGKKKNDDDDEEEPVLVMFNDDDKFW